MKIRELFSDESRWTKGTSARDQDGIPTWVGNPNTVCHCLLGAISFCYPSSEYRRIRDRIRWAIGLDTHIGKWNDDPERTFEEVKKLVDELDI